MKKTFSKNKPKAPGGARGNNHLTNHIMSYQELKFNSKNTKIKQAYEEFKKNGDKIPYSYYEENLNGLRALRVKFLKKGYSLRLNEDMFFYSYSLGDEPK